MRRRSALYLRNVTTSPQAAAKILWLSPAADFVQELTEETTAIPQNSAYYINYDAMARDMGLSGDVFIIRTGFEEMHVFWER